MSFDFDGVCRDVAGAFRVARKLGDEMERLVNDLPDRQASDQEFKDLLDDLRSARFDDEKIVMLKSYHRAIAGPQLDQLLEEFTSDDGRLQAVKMLAPLTISRPRLRSFDFSSERMRAFEILSF